MKAYYKPILLFISAVLFTLSFPNVLFQNGIAILAYLIVIPIIIVVDNTSVLISTVMGFIYGFVTYAMFNFWLFKFTPAASLIVLIIFGTNFAVLFLFLSSSNKLFGKYSWIIQVFIWVLFDYATNHGFVSYSFGNLAYTQSQNQFYLKLASITGVWGVDFCILLIPTFLSKTIIFEDGKFVIRWEVLKKYKFFLGGFIILLCCFNLFFFLESKIESNKNIDKKSIDIRIGLSQTNVDPWLVEYEETLNDLLEQSKEAIDKGCELIIWPETAFVPSIEWHNRYRNNRKSYNLVRKLLNFLESTSDVFFVVGNDERVRTDNKFHYIDYNTAYYYLNGEVVDKYRKIKLAPFTEYFPYKNIFPGFYKWLIEQDVHQWEPGIEYKTFKIKGVAFSVLICFEDLFPQYTRRNVLNGAEFVCVLANDAWGKSNVVQRQHLSTSVFRAAENGIYVCRSTASGATCIISPNGIIESELDYFKKDILISNIKIKNHKATIYTKYGDWFAYLSLFVIFAALLCKIILLLCAKHKIKT